MLTLDDLELGMRFVVPSGLHINPRAATSTVVVHYIDDRDNVHYYHQGEPTNIKQTSGERFIEIVRNCTRLAPVQVRQDKLRDDLYTPKDL